MATYPGRETWTIETWDPATGAFVAADEWPTPDTTPFEPAIRSNLRMFRTITGQTVGIYPNEKFTMSTMQMQWTALSGSWFKEALEDYIRSGTGLRVTPHTGAPFSGVIVEMRPAGRPGFLDAPAYTNRGTLWDIAMEFQPLNVESGT